MAKRTIIEDGLGSVGEIAAPTLHEGEVTQATLISIVADMLAVLRAVTQRLNGQLSRGSGITGHRTGNFHGQYIDVLTPSVADTEFSVPHGLGRLAIGIDVAQQDKAGSIYTSSIGSWSEEILFLKASAASMSLKLQVY